MVTPKIYIGRSKLGYRFICDVGFRRAEGWRPTKGWARKVAVRKAAKVEAELGEDGHGPIGDGHSTGT